jgi:hypothetical protein
MTRFEEIRAKDKERKEKEIKDFLSNVNVLHNNIDSVVMPSVEIMKESDKCYISYYVCKYPNCLVYSISMCKKEHPFSTYYSKKFYKNEIPVKYAEQFKKLEAYFK